MMRQLPTQESSQEVREYFNETVPHLENGYCHYRWNRSPLVREHYLQTLETLNRILASRQWDSLAEIGCGPYIWTSLLFEHAQKGVAVDLSVEMLKQRPPRDKQERCCCGDATQLPLKSHCFDAVCSIRAFEYFPDKVQAIREFNRVLKPQGFVMIVTKNHEYLGYGRNTEGESAQIHNGNITSAEMREILTAEGFSNVQIRPVILGRTRVRLIWKMIRVFRRFVSDSYSSNFSNVVSGLTESFMITAQKR